MPNLRKELECGYGTALLANKDFGVDDFGRTLLIEVNDGYALGNYGLSPKQYAEMTMNRWKEITK